MILCFATIIKANIHGTQAFKKLDGKE